MLVQYPTKTPSTYIGSFIWVLPPVEYIALPLAASHSTGTCVCMGVARHAGEAACHCEACIHTFRVRVGRTRFARKFELFYYCGCPRAAAARRKAVGWGRAAPCSRVVAPAPAWAGSSGRAGVRTWLNLAPWRGRADGGSESTAAAVAAGAAVAAAAAAVAVAAKAKTNAGSAGTKGGGSARGPRDSGRMSGG